MPSWLVTSMDPANWKARPAVGAALSSLTDDVPGGVGEIHPEPQRHAGWEFGASLTTSVSVLLVCHKVFHMRVLHMSVNTRLESTAHLFPVFL